MSSILDALKKVEQEKAAANRADDGYLDANDLIAGRAHRERTPFSVSPVALLIGAIVLASVIGGISAGVALMLTRSKPAPQLEIAKTAPPAVQAETPAPKPAPEPAPTATPVPAPAPVSAPTPEPVAKAAPVPEPVAKPAPAPEPVKAPAPVPAPPPKPAPAPKPAPQPVQAAKPTPAPEPKPAPVPPPAEKPVPEPAPKAAEPPAPAAVEPPKPEPEPVNSLAEPAPVVMAEPAEQHEAPRADAPKKVAGNVDIMSFPPLRASDKTKYGLDDLHVNMVRPASKARPYASAIINLEPVQVGERISGSQAILVGVESRAIAVEIEGTGQRYQIRF